MQALNIKPARFALKFGEDLGKFSNQFTVI